MKNFINQQDDTRENSFNQNSKQNAKSILIQLSVPLIGLVIFLNLGIYGAQWFFESDFVTGKKFTVPGGYTGFQFFGVVLMNFLLPFSVLLVIVLATQFYHLAKIQKVLSIVGNLAFFVVSLTLTVLTYKNYGFPVIECGIMGCVFKDISSLPNYKPQPTEIYFGTIYFITLVILDILFFIAIIFQLFSGSLSSSDSDNEKKISQSIQQYNYQKIQLLQNQQQNQYKIYLKYYRNQQFIANSLVAFFLIIIFPLLFFSSFLLPTSFQSWTPSYMIQRANKKEINTSEYPNALFKSSVVQLNDNNIYLVIYPDILIFYIYFYALIVMGILGQHFKKFFNQKIVLTKFNISYSYGLLFVTISYITLLIFWLIYWLQSHSWIGDIEKTKTYTENIARTSGQVSNLLIGLLLLPIARNSIWSKIFGISWEESIIYHKFLGYSLLLSIFTHMISWWIVYGQQNFFPHDIISFVTYYPADGSTSPIANGDNWTIPLMTYTTYIGYVLMFVFSLEKFRRKSFELFYYSHQYYVVFISVALWHANSIQYFIIPGIVLYAADRVIRFFKELTKFELKSANTYDEVTELRLTKPRTLLSKQFQFIEGNYSFINIPKISIYQWHPFTISSSPLDNELTFHIKNMGNDQWTGQLYNLVKRNQINGDNDILIDGPYGKDHKLDSYDRILLIVGGIGITPAHSIFRTLLLLQKLNQQKKQYVKLMWTSRNLDTFKIFLNTLKEVDIDSMEQRFSYNLYCTQQQKSADIDEEIEYLNDKVKFQRPNLYEEIFNFYTYGQNQITTENFIFSCGPTQLVQEVEKLVDNMNSENGLNIQQHTEIFEF